MRRFPRQLVEPGCFLCDVRHRLVVNVLVNRCLSECHRRFLPVLAGSHRPDIEPKVQIESARFGWRFVVIPFRAWQV